MVSQQQTLPPYISLPSTVLRVSIGLLLLCSGGVVLLVAELLLLPWRHLRIYAGNIYGKVLGPLVVRLAGARVVFENRDRIGATKPAIVVTNHSSDLDALTAIWVCPLGGAGVGKKQVARYPFFGWAYKLSGHLTIDRSRPERVIAAFNEVAEVVKRYGLSLWLWPEGTRSPDGRLMRFKKGFVHLAIATGFPVLPVVFHGAPKIWRAGTYRTRPGTLRVEVLEPIATTAWTKDSIDDHVQEVWAKMNAALDPELQQTAMPAAYGPEGLSLATANDLLEGVS